MDTEFPWRIYTDKELQDEYYRLKKHMNKIITFPIPISRIGFKCNNVFFQYERMNTAGNGRPSTVDYWKKSINNVIKFSKAHGRDLFSTLNYFNHSPSQFPIIIAGKIYRYFKATKIFDPYAGWGDRCLAAMALDIDYIGIDNNINLKKPFEQLLKTYDTKSNIQIKFCKSENIDIGKLTFDFVFTSPPFWEKGKILEKYNECESNYDKFIENSLIPVINKCKKKTNIWVCLYINEEMYIDIKNIIGNCDIILTFKTSNKRTGNIYCWNF